MHARLASGFLLVACAALVLRVRLVPLQPARVDADRTYTGQDGREHVYSAISTATSGGWFGDYHSMDVDYGYRPDELASELARETGCLNVRYDVEGTEAVGSLTLDRYRYQVACPSVRKGRAFLGYDGTVLVSLGKARVYRLVDRRPR